MKIYTIEEAVKQIGKSYIVSYDERAIERPNKEHMEYNMSFSPTFIVGFEYDASLNQILFKGVRLRELEYSKIEGKNLLEQLKAIKDMKGFYGTVYLFKQNELFTKEEILNKVSGFIDSIKLSVE
jgi:hypothetical protein